MKFNRIKTVTGFIAGFLLMGVFNLAFGGGMPQSQRRDSWGIFEFLHFHTEAAKQKEAESVIHDILCGLLEQTGTNLTSGGNNYLMTFPGEETLIGQLELIYGGITSVPTDIYRTAIQQVQDQDLTKIKNKYPKLTDGEINMTFMEYYDQGQGPGTKTIESVEKAKQEIEDLKNVKRIDPYTLK